MRVFVTGASGWIGSAVVPELIARAIRSPARPLGCLGRCPQRGRAQVHRGTLDDLDSLRSAATTSDGVIHLAFKHDIAFSGDFEALPMRTAAPSRHSARRLPFRSAVRHRLRTLGLAPGGWRPNRTGMVPIRP